MLASLTCNNITAIVVIKYMQPEPTAMLPYITIERENSRHNMDTSLIVTLSVVPASYVQTDVCKSILELSPDLLIGVRNRVAAIAVSVITLHSSVCVSKVEPTIFFR